ncbi:hypothetical protein Acr_10g0009230 [Actinidia rufa]|uniref:Uncharacterized protein n=1 Tax=Actinidia rufa TaxID=165716 RepID=A0A7J0FA24_9ERIC|nr:hypothetical protein Acr_10g0009230 [Actinidia rufa]
MLVARVALVAYKLDCNFGISLDEDVCEAETPPEKARFIFDIPISVELNKGGWWRYPVSEDGGCGARGYGSVLDTQVPFSGFGQDGVNFCVDGRFNSILRIRELFHSQIIQQEIGKVMFHGKPDGWRILILRFGMSQSAVGWLRKGEEHEGQRLFKVIPCVQTVFGAKPILQSQPEKMLDASVGPVNVVHALMSVTGLSKEVSVEFIKCVGDGFREEVALHDIGRDGAIDRLDESDSSSHAAKVFANMVRDWDVKDVGKVVPAEILKDSVDVMEITLGCFPKENDFVGKEEMGEAGTITFELNRLPKIKSTSIFGWQSIMVKHLLNNDDVFRYPTAFDEAGLEGADEVVEERFKAEGNGFGDEFVDGIAEANGAEWLTVSGVATLGIRQSSVLLMCAGLSPESKACLTRAWTECPTMCRQC